MIIFIIEIASNGCIRSDSRIDDSTRSSTFEPFGNIVGSLTITTTCVKEFQRFFELATLPKCMLAIG